MSLPTPPALLFTPIPGTAQLRQVGNCKSKQLPAHWHHTRALLYLTRRFSPLSLSPPYTFLKIGQGSVSSIMFNRQAPHKVACLCKRCKRGLPPQRHQFEGAHAPTPGPKAARTCEGTPLGLCSFPSSESALHVCAAFHQRELTTTVLLAALLWKLLGVTRLERTGWYLPLSNKSEFLLCLCWQCKKLLYVILLCFKI